MSKLWKKSGIKLHPLVEAFTVGEDYLLDMELLPYDIIGTSAHVKGLTQLGILKKSELNQIIARLKKLQKAFNSGKIKIKPQDEDCHTVIENFVTKGLKKTGKKIHTGRSRNDQVLTAIRLYMRDKGKEIHKEGKQLAKQFLDFTEDYKDIPMPGYTHTQQAMLSSVGHWSLSFTEALFDDLTMLKTISNHIDQNPLGSAAGFGVNLILPREMTTREMRFKKTQLNSLYCQASRGKFESLFLEALVQIMLTLGRFASDLIFFTSRELDFFKVKDSLVTGSSIMPQKRNLDAMEILRANVSVLIANQNLIKDIIKGQISGYHRDLQLIKKPLIEGIKLTLQSIKITSLYLKGIKPNSKKIAAAITPEIFTADLATELATKKGIPFRTAYTQALKKLKKYNPDPKENLSKKVSLGAAGNLDIHYYKRNITKI